MGRKRVVSGLLLATAFVAIVQARAQGQVTAELVSSGFSLPVYLTHAPGDPYRVYVVEKAGRIQILDLRSPGAGSTLFLDITARVGGGLFSFDERGFLGLAFDPDYDMNGRFYVNYTNTSFNTVISEFTRLTPDSADAGSERIMLTVNQPDSNHNGGWIGFGPNDGFLYIASGDGGGQGDPAGHGQNIATVLGTMMRLDVNGSNGFNGQYGIPIDNPFVGVAGADEIWAYGLRNPWRPSFDRVTGDLYIADVGQNIWEEINFQPATSIGGENYGWRCFEGNATFNTTGNCNPAPATTMPFHTYSHSVGCSITGGYVYRGCAIAALDGFYFFADFCTNNVWAGQYDDVLGVFTNLALRNVELGSSGSVLNAISSFGEDAFGEMYIVSQDGPIYRIEPAGGIIDCNANNVDDACEIALGLVADVNANGVPDECGPCPGDANGDRVVDFGDITSVLSNWLADYSPGTGPGDASGNGLVNFEDITAVLSNWLMPCP